MGTRARIKDSDRKQSGRRRAPLCCPLPLQTGSHARTACSGGQPPRLSAPPPLTSAARAAGLSAALLVGRQRGGAATGGSAAAAGRLGCRRLPPWRQLPAIAMRGRQKEPMARSLRQRGWPAAAPWRRAASWLPALVEVCGSLTNHGRSASHATKPAHGPPPPCRSQAACGTAPIAPMPAGAQSGSPMVALATCSLPSQSSSHQVSSCKNWRPGPPAQQTAVEAAHERRSLWRPLQALPAAAVGGSHDAVQAY